MVKQLNAVSLHAVVPPAAMCAFLCSLCLFHIADHGTITIQAKCSGVMMLGAVQALLLIDSNVICPYPVAHICCSHHVLRCRSHAHHSHEGFTHSKVGLRR